MSSLPIPSRGALPYCLVPEWNRVTDSGCWEWTGTRTAAGYGIYGKVYVHRAAWELYRGPIPEGLEIDHLCRNRACFNPNHLEPVTHAENMRRGYFGAKTECPKGHPYDDENTQINSINGGRQCRECIRQRKKAAYRVANPEDRSAASRTHCPKGHPLSGDNLHRHPPSERHPNGRRECKTCRRESNRVSALRAYYRKKEAAS